ncbi:NADH-quinone oxidoreductase subunit E [Rhodoligotrophos appendicifer]|uniref:NADH-quinone oxidoreductase subunit NuoE n=1 Tax=Rhodoligotrophos appendicifer TaxID=987056 RepID=UPI0011846B73|nr:NADH-quinone oxidoreductase subunit NuoE [Rhodoligotrophos appendicifer]
MSVRRLDPIQPESFVFTADNLDWATMTISKYPEGRQASAVISLLWRAQEQSGGWLPEPAIRYVAQMLDMAYIRVLEVATFYTMFNLSPVGKHYVQLCGTTPCWLRGADALKEVCRREIGEPGHVSADGMFSWQEVECLGACVNAPMVQINFDFFEDLDAESLTKVLAEFRAGGTPKPGPQDDRINSAPAGGPTTLTDVHLYDGNYRKVWAGEAFAAGETATAGGGADAQEPIKKGKPKSVQTGERKPKGTPRGADADSADEAATHASTAPGEAVPPGAAPQSDGGKE